MTTTHDLPTVAGWWRGSDIETRAGLHLLGSQAAREHEQATRDADRAMLWQAFCEAGAAAPPPPVSAQTAQVVDAATRFIASTPSELALLPLEDALGVEEQPNLPGTIDEHPNWRRRYAVPVEKIFDVPAVRARTRMLDLQRPRERT